MYKKLAAYEYETDKAVGRDLNPWTDKDLNGNKPFLLYNNTDAVPVGYIDITSVSNYQNFAFAVNGYDYKYVRDALKDFITEIGETNTLGTESDPSNISSPATDNAYIVGTSAVGDFVNQENKVAIYNGSSWDFRWKYEHGFEQLTPTEKVVAVTHKAATTSQRIGTVGIDNAIGLGIQYHANAVEVRQTRMAYATGQVLSRLPENGGEVMQDIISNADNMFITYTFFGIEGSIEDGPWDSPNEQVEGIADYFYGRAGTQFEGNGLVDKPWTPIGITLTELADTLYAILMSGEY